MELTVLSEIDDLLHVQAKGRIVQSDLAGDEPMAGLLENGAEPHHVLLNLSDVDYIDSSGIGWLLARHKQLRQRGGMLVLHSASSGVLDVVKMLRLDSVFHLADDESAAVVLARGGDR